MGAHLTSNNFIRNFVTLVNKVNGFLNANTTYADFDACIADTSSTVATLKTKLDAIGGISLINQKPVIKELLRVIDQLSALKIKMAVMGTVSGSNITTATSGGDLTNSTTYYFKAVAVDADGNLSEPSAQMSKQTGAGGAGNAHTITLKNFTPIDGAVSYRIYVATSSETFTLGYFAVTKANMEGSTGGTYTGTGTTLTAGTIPTALTATAKTPLLTDDNMVTAVAASSGETAALLTAVTAKAVSSSAVSTSASAGEQWI